MVELIYKCNRCGKSISEKRVDSVPEWRGRVGYGSRHDGEYLDVHLCSKCFDEVIKELSEKFAISPLPFEECTCDDMEDL